MNTATYVPCVAVLSGLAWIAQSVGQPMAAGRVSLELVTTRHASMTSAHDWSRALGRLGVDNVRIRAARGRERPAIDTEGGEVSRTHRVRGLVVAGDRVQVPGASFSLNQAQQFHQWLDRLAAGGVDEVAAERVAFGMTPRQLIATHDALRPPVAHSTTEVDAAKLARQLLEESPLPTLISPEAARSMRQQFTLPDSFQGLSRGTVLAAALRPLGLAMVPHVPRPGAGVRLEVRDARDAPESWPVGWPLGDQAVREVAPNLFAFLEIRFQDAPLDQVLDALGQRLELPMLMDHHGLARHDIDPANVRVTIAPRKTFYKRILDKALAQGKMKAEIRLDEAGRPFLWILPVMRHR